MTKNDDEGEEEGTRLLVLEKSLMTRESRQKVRKKFERGAWQERAASRPATR
jgi:hypothetical protein